MSACGEDRNVHSDVSIPRRLATGRTCRIAFHLWRGAADAGSAESGL